MKIICEIKTGKAGTRTFTNVEGEPKNPAERIIFDCIHAAVNVGLDKAAEMLNAHQVEQVMPAKVESIMAAVNPNARCNKELMETGKPMPRTCAICTLGPCHFHR